MKESSPEEIKEFLNTSTEANKYIVDDTKLAVCGVIFAHRENDTECVCLAEKFMEEYEATMAEKRKQDEEDLKRLIKRMEGNGATVVAMGISKE